MKQLIYLLTAGCLTALLAVSCQGDADRDTAAPAPGAKAKTEIAQTGEANDFPGFETLSEAADSEAWKWWRPWTNGRNLEAAICMTQTCGDKLQRITYNLQLITYNLQPPSKQLVFHQAAVEAAGLERFFPCRLQPDFPDIHGVAQIDIRGRSRAFLF